MPYDYSLLAGKVKEFFGTQCAFSDAIALSERSVSLKMQGKISWKQSEIEKICEVLRLERMDIPVYFFTLKVQS